MITATITTIIVLIMDSPMSEQRVGAPVHLNAGARVMRIMDG
jgi:hypothetical protein